MKTRRLLLGLGFAVCFASAYAELAPVSFTVGKQQFKAGDSIVIDQVQATSPQLERGARVVVRGHYQLASTASASIGLFITEHGPATAGEAQTSQMSQANSGNGTFELSCTIDRVGEPHVSFYPAGGGETFGGVYFSTRSNNPE
jgi:hypothetical protein